MSPSERSSMAIRVKRSRSPGKSPKKKVGTRTDRRKRQRRESRTASRTSTKDASRKRPEVTGGRWSRRLKDREVSLQAKEGAMLPQPRPLAEKAALPRSILRKGRARRFSLSKNGKRAHEESSIEEGRSSPSPAKVAKRRCVDWCSPRGAEFFPTKPPSLSDMVEIPPEEARERFTGAPRPELKKRSELEAQPQPQQAKEAATPQSRPLPEKAVLQSILRKGGDRRFPSPNGKRAGEEPSTEGAESLSPTKYMPTDRMRIDWHSPCGVEFSPSKPPAPSQLVEIPPEEVREQFTGAPRPELKKRSELEPQPEPQPQLQPQQANETAMLQPQPFPEKVVLQLILRKGQARRCPSPNGKRVRDEPSIEEGQSSPAKPTERLPVHLRSPCGAEFSPSEPLAPPSPMVEIPPEEIGPVHDKVPHGLLGGILRSLDTFWRQVFHPSSLMALLQIIRMR